MRVFGARRDGYSPAKEGRRDEVGLKWKVHVDLSVTLFRRFPGSWGILTWDLSGGTMRDLASCRGRLCSLSIATFEFYRILDAKHDPELFPNFGILGSKFEFLRWPSCSTDPRLFW